MTDYELARRSSAHVLLTVDQGQATVRFSLDRLDPF